ncbi:hypothetical protein, partial [Rhizobium lusitanum]|uniref:hypothetical protein n=1 Tax=Rhizobium lusitanum TaxID=293958 RepID=UPI0019531766
HMRQRLGAADITRTKSRVSFWGPNVKLLCRLLRSVAFFKPADKDKASKLEPWAVAAIEEFDREISVFCRRSRFKLV